MFNNDDEDIIQGLQIAAPTKESIILEGVLKKKSPKGFIKAWQDRLIVLTRDGLFYYKCKDIKEAKLSQFQGAVPLRAIASILPSPRKGFRFDITLEEQYGRVFSFTARTEQEVQKWVMQTTLAWNDVKDAEKAAGVNSNQNAQQPPPVPGGGKFWRNPNAQVKKADTKGAGNVVANRALYSPEVQFFLQTYKPIFKQLNARPQPPPGSTQCQFSLQQLLSTLFCDFKVQSNESDGGSLGTVYLIGNSHYQLTHRSYLLHCVSQDHPYIAHAVNCMQTLRDLRFPLFPTQIHCGETRDTIYSIYHPPLRSNTDALFCWLQAVHQFPEHVVQWILVHLVITLQLLHQHDILFHSLSPEFTFFDRDGVFRICDLFLSKDINVSTIAHNIPEYDPPEVVAHNLQHGPQPNHLTASVHTFAGDFWRLGVFLYELSTGLPPFRATDVSADLHYDTVYQRIQEYKANTLIFPDFISKPLRDLINSLLHPDPTKRLSSIDTLLQHPFLASVDPQLYDITYLLTRAPKPEWIMENIVMALERDEVTPQNLTFIPDQPLVHRLHCRLLQARHMQGIEYLAKVQFNLQLDPDQYKTRIISLDGTGTQAPPSSPGGGGLFNPSNAKTMSRLGFDGLTQALNVGIDETFTFDFVHPHNTSYWPDLVLEVHGQKRDSVKDSASHLPGVSDKSGLGKSSTLFAICTVPLSQLRSQGLTEGWFNMYSVTTMEPCGEIKLNLEWESEYVSLDQGVLQGLSDPTRLFAQCFGKIVPAPNKKLWSTIVDASANPYDPPGVEDPTQTHLVQPNQEIDPANFATMSASNTAYLNSPTMNSTPSHTSPSSYSLNQNYPNSSLSGAHPTIPPPIPAVPSPSGPQSRSLNAYPPEVPPPIPAMPSDAPPPVIPPLPPSLPQQPPQQPPSQPTWRK